MNRSQRNRHRYAASPNRRSRNAITLLETLATMSLLLMIAVAAIEMLGSVTEIGIRNNEARQSGRSALRFADRFRVDVKQTKQLTEIEDGRGIEILRDDGAVQYTWDDDVQAILRIVRVDEEILERDRFAFSTGSVPQFSVIDGRAVVVLKQGEHRWVVEALQ